MKEKFVLYWKLGDKEIVEGETIVDAFNNAGYGGGAISALDFFSRDVENQYEWIDGKWVKK